MVFGPSVHALVSPGKIVVDGDEWALSDAGLSDDGMYATNVLAWFGLLPSAAGKNVLILDGQSWNGGYDGTYGAFGLQFQALLNGLGASVTYVSYTGSPGPIAAYSAVFVDGCLANAPTLTNDLAAFVSNGGCAYVAGGTGTFPGGNASAEAAYWQPFFTAVTGSSDFGLGNIGWFDLQGALSSSGPVGQGVIALDWFDGQNVSVGTNPNASPAIWNSSYTLVATWWPQAPVEFTAIQPTTGGSFQLTALGPTNLAYTVWASDNLTQGNWLSIGSATIAGNLIQFVDTNAGNFTRRFYRLSGQ